MEEILQELRRQKSQLLVDQAQLVEIELVDAQIRGVDLVKYKLIQMLHDGKTLQEIKKWVLM